MGEAPLFIGVVGYSEPHAVDVEALLPQSPWSVSWKSADLPQGRIHVLAPEDVLGVAGLSNSHDSDVRFLAGWVRLDNRPELAVELGWGASRCGSCEDWEYILSAYERWGEACVSRLEGDFSFALWDPHRGSIFAARDSLGIRPFYFARTSWGFAFAASAAHLDTLPGIDNDVRPDWLALYLHGLSTSWSRTALSGVNKLPPGHQLVADAETVTVTRFHHFVDDAPWEDTRDERWLEAYSHALTQAVRARIDTGGPVGVETSGGLDSSTIVALIAKLGPDVVPTMHTFGYALESLEPEFILETSRVWGVPFNHILCNAPGAEVERRGWQTVGYPVEHGNSVYHEPFYALASQFGVRTLHSGHGGDETVTSDGELVMRELMNRGRWLPIMRNLPGPPAHRPARLAKRWRRRNTGEASARLTAAMLRRLRWSPLRDEVLASVAAERLTREAALYDAPYDTLNSFIIGNRLGPHVSTRTSECSIVAASYGIDYRWPLLDRRLIQQYLSTPAIWKYGEGIGRYLHRRAVAGIVPDKITWRATKAMRRPGEAPPGSPDSPRPRKNPTLHPSDLHPVLGAIVDSSKLRRLSTEGLVQEHLGASMILRKLNTANQWLHERGG